MEILYIGWVGCNNIGDELMLDNFKELVKKNIKKEYNITAIMCDQNFDDFDKYDLVCLGGGSILLKGFIEVIYRAIKKNKKVMIWGSGYDAMIEENFWNEIEKSDFAYIYSDIIEEKLEVISKKAVFFGVRGPMTYSILEKSNVDMENIIISGDPGFLLEEDEEFNNPYNFNIKDNYVGINVGTMFNKIYGGDEKYLFDEIVKVSQYLLKNGYKLYLYTMWPEDVSSILDFYNKLEDKDNIILDLDTRSGTELLTIIKNCVFTINFKLHANVISAVGEVPFICLAYRFKCYDFIKSLNQEKLLVKTDNKKIYKDIIRKIQYIKVNREKISKELKTKILDYKENLNKSIDNF